MRVLLIKTSSLGDIIHTFPALTDAVAAIPGIRFDWLVEEGFTDLPALHPAVDRVIALPWRRLRRQLWLPGAWRELGEIREQLRKGQYDLVIDAQGLIKSALWTSFVRAPAVGLDAESAREPLASRFYDRRCTVAWGQHAIDRVRQLFAAALGYDVPNMSEVNYGLVPRLRVLPDADAPAYWVFAHATTWESKHWPEAYWQQLVLLAARLRRRVLLPWHGEAELARAQRLARMTTHVQVLPELSLKEMTRVLADAELVVGVDTGLSHLAAALHRPVVALYGSTEPGLTGVVGPGAVVLQAQFPCAPCLREHCSELTDERSEPPCYVQALNADRVSRVIEGMLS